MYFTHGNVHGFQQCTSHTWALPWHWKQRQRVALGPETNKDKEWKPRSPFRRLNQRQYFVSVKLGHLIFILIARRSHLFFKSPDSMSLCMKSCQSFIQDSSFVLVSLHASKCQGPWLAQLCKLMLLASVADLGVPFIVLPPHPAATVEVSCIDPFSACFKKKSDHDLSSNENQAINLSTFTLPLHRI